MFGKMNHTPAAPSRLHLYGVPASDFWNIPDPLELAAIRFVQQLEVRSSLTGYHCLIRAIVLAVRNPLLLRSLSNGLYPAVARHCGYTAGAVERNIRRAIESAYESNPEKIQQMFYYKVNKPYNSEVIALAVERIRYELTAEHAVSRTNH